MASFATNLWQSIFTPGATPALLVATNVTFAALQAVLAFMLYATHSVHFIVLSVLCAGLWVSINWFARELKVHQLAEEEQARREQATKPPPASSGDSETEVEGSKPVTSLRKSARLASKQPAPAATTTEAEPAEEQGELKLRVPLDTSFGSSQSLRSGVSTEDEWEKVSEHENEKDK